MNIRTKNRTCLNLKEIRQYLEDQGSFSRDELHELESHLLDCELCDTAVEGYRFLQESDNALYQNKMSEMSDDNLSKARDVVFGVLDSQEGPKSTINYRLLDGESGSNPSFDKTPRDVSNIAAEGAMEYKKTLNGRNQAHQEGGATVHKSSGFFRKSWGLRVAASLLMAGIVGMGIFSIYFKGLDVAEVFGQGEDLVIRVRGAEGSMESSEVQGGDRIELALAAFERGEFLLSGELFEAEMSSEGGNSALAFFAGLSFLNSGELKKAGFYLPKSVEKQHVFIEEAYWHLARFHLETGDEEAARGALEYLRDSEDKELRKKAVKVLRRL